MGNNQVALEGIRVIDLSRVLAGPFCTMLLADLGAEVIKIEIPGKGDDTRGYPPFIGSESAYFMNLNRNKKSLTLNVKSSLGRDVFFDLVKVSDVVVENFKPGVMDRLGIGYGKLKEINSGIVVSSISGFGQYGPYKNLPGYDIIGQAMGGIMSVTGWPDGPPTRTGTAIADILTGLFSCIGILSGLIARNNIHSGQHVDISIVDSVVSAMETIIEIYLTEGRQPGRTGNRYEFIYPYDTFQARDGWVVVGVGNDTLWRKFCVAIDRVDLQSETKYLSNDERVRHHDEIKEIVEAWTGSRTCENVIRILTGSTIPCARIYSVQDVVNDKHISLAREMILDLKHPIAGDTQVVGCPIKMSETPARITEPAPTLGQHNHEILKNILHYSDEKIKALCREKVL